jgi:hypothetical protein
MDLARLIQVHRTNKPSQMEGNPGAQLLGLKFNSLGVGRVAFHRRMPTSSCQYKMDDQFPKGTPEQTQLI